MTADEFEALFRAAGISTAEACRRAHIAQSTFHRWKTGVSGLTIGTYSKLLDVIAAGGSSSESKIAE